MKKIKGLKEAHTPNTKIGKGDHYGSGIKNPVGKSKEILGVNPLKPKKMGKAPKSLA